MHGNVAKELNRKNFVEAYQALKSFHAFPFFGTLLGIVRGGDIIEGDDDVDFYVDVKFKDAAKGALVDRGFVYEAAVGEASSINFMQFRKQLTGVDTYVDVYLYETCSDGKFVIDKWNFLGKPECPSCHLNVDFEMLFPLSEISLFGQMIALPKKPEVCCEFLYGPSWRIQKSKSASEYMTLIHHNTPIVFEGDDYIFKLLKERLDLESWCAELSAARDWWREHYENLNDRYNHTQASLVSQSEWLNSLQEGKDWLEKQWQQSLATIEEQNALIATLSSSAAD